MQKTKILKKSEKFFVLFIFFLISALHIDVYADKKSLVPIGKTVGISVEIQGVVVLGTSEFENVDGEITSPAAEAGIMAGDVITQINGNNISSSERFAELTNKFGSEDITVTYRRGQEEKETVVQAKSASDGRYRLGVWIKDYESGIGTVTYYNPETSEFGALGHGICNMSNELTDISGGLILKAEIASVKRGEKGEPGEIIGVFTEDSEKVGTVSENTDVGVFGELDEALVATNPVETAERSEVKEGEAVILSNIEGDEVCEYSVEITKINKDERNTKGMIVKVTDSRLIEKTGGIVQGMSGSPILQDGKLVGAVTHVFVNDPTRGYGIFIENMFSR